MRIKALAVAPTPALSPALDSRRNLALYALKNRIPAVFSAYCYTDISIINREYAKFQRGEFRRIAKNGRSRVTHGD
jgi:hypothetical protein